MDESYKMKKEREERERQFQKKKRLETARRAYLEFINDPKAFNLGVKFNMIDQLAEELAQYLDMVDCRRVLTEMLEFVYDPSVRPEDPVDYFAKLTKDRKKDKRELNKARRYLYQLLWKEYNIKEEIAKLTTLLSLISPRGFKSNGMERTKEEKEEYDRDLERSVLNEQVLKTESLKSLMSHKDEMLPSVYGTYSAPVPEPIAITGKEAMAERALLLEKLKKKKGSVRGSKSSGKKRLKKKSKSNSKGSKSRSPSMKGAGKMSKARSPSRPSSSGNKLSKKKSN